MTRNARVAVVCMALLALWRGSAAAQEQENERWVSVGTEAGVEIQLDTASIVEIDESLFEAWLRQDFAEPRIFLVDRFDRRLALERYDCRMRRRRPLWFRLLRGEELIQDRRFSPSYWMPIVPESADERIWRRVCGGGG